MSENGISWPQILEMAGWITEVPGWQIIEIRLIEDIWGYIICAKYGEGPYPKIHFANEPSTRERVHAALYELAPE